MFKTFWYLLFWSLVTRHFVPGNVLDPCVIFPETVAFVFAFVLHEHVRDTMPNRLVPT